MWDLPKGEEFLWKVSTEELEGFCRVEKNSKARLRFLAALKRREGKSLDAIARDLGMGRRTVHEWLRRFVVMGLGGAYDKKQPGRPRRLTEAQLRELRRDLIAGPERFGFSKQLWTTRMVQEHVKRKFRADYVDRHMRRLLRGMGFSVQKPRPVHYKADKRVQERFKKTSGRSWVDTGSGASR